MAAALTQCMTLGGAAGTHPTPFYEGNRKMFRVIFVADQILCAVGLLLMVSLGTRTACHQFCVLLCFVTGPLKELARTGKELK